MHVSTFAMKLFMYMTYRNVVQSRPHTYSSFFIAKPCPTLLAPLNGNISGCPSDNQTTGALCKFACNRGFTLVGDSERSCSPRGKWIGSPVKCEPMKCDQLTPPENSALLPPCSNDFMSSCSVLCDFGYNLTGPLQQSCNFNTSGILDWTDPPTCIGKLYNY